MSLSPDAGGGFCAPRHLLAGGHCSRHRLCPQCLRSRGDDEGGRGCCCSASRDSADTDGSTCEPELLQYPDADSHSASGYVHSDSFTYCDLLEIVEAATPRNSLSCLGRESPGSFESSKFGFLVRTPVKEAPVGSPPMCVLVADLSELLDLLSLQEQQQSQRLHSLSFSLGSTGPSSWGNLATERMQSTEEEPASALIMMDVAELAATEHDAETSCSISDVVWRSAGRQGSPGSGLFGSFRCGELAGDSVAFSSVSVVSAASSVTPRAALGDKFRRASECEDTDALVDAGAQCMPCCWPRAASGGALGESVASEEGERDGPSPECKRQAWRVLRCRFVSLAGCLHRCVDGVSHAVVACMPCRPRLCRSSEA